MAGMQIGMAGLPNTQELEKYYQKEFAARQEGLARAKMNMARILLDAGLDWRQASLAVGMVMAGNTANLQEQIKTAPPITIPLNAKKEIDKAVSGLAKLAAALEPYLPVSVQVDQNDLFSASIRIIAWADPSQIERALLGSPFAKEDIIQKPAGFLQETAKASYERGEEWKTAIQKAAKTKVQENDYLDDLQLLRQLHQLAYIRSRQYDLNMQKVFPQSLEKKWIEAAKPGGPIHLPIAIDDAAAKEFYEKLAEDYAQVLQQMAGIKSGIQIYWEGKKEMVVEAGLPIRK